MASALRRPNLVERVVEYAQKTKIDFKLTSRLSPWQAAGLPDLRGFCPHLRRVNLYADQKNLRNLKKLKIKALQEIRSGSPGPALWILHDILHIAFYDFATLNLGKESWLIKERFLESHLASELFSVLTLDYFFLIFTKTKGLAVHLDPRKWPQFQRVNPDLPELGTFELCHFLFELYLIGGTPKPTTLASYKEWIGHEIRYASKQRRYVMQWWDDLNGNKDSKIKASVVGSEVFHAVWELMGIFLNAQPKSWNFYLKKILKSKNVFSGFKKYRESFSDFDFRFTDIQSLSKLEVIKFVERAAKPSSSTLFLFWQILSTFPILRFDRRTRSHFIELAKEANNEKGPSLDLWNAVRSVVQSAARGPYFLPGRPKPETRSTFFLP